MKSKIFMIGMYHLGCVNAAGMSSFGHEVTCFDYNDKVTENLSKGIFPIHEEGFDYLFAEGKIKYTHEIKDVENQDFIFITYDIEANGVTIDVIDVIINSLRSHIKNQIIVVRSQVPVGTCDKIKKELGCEVCYIPENLRLGTAVRNFFYPEWMVFGLSSESIKQKIVELFAEINTEKIFMGLKESEMVKLTMNCYLATMISFSGQISDICEENKINAKKILSTLKYDSRVGTRAPIIPGLGFSGGTIERDLNALRKSVSDATLLNSVHRFNEIRKEYIYQTLEKLLRSYDGRTITFFGATYKSGTNTLRDSPVVFTVKKIKREHPFNVRLKVYDPLVKSGIDGVEFIDINGAKDSDAIVIVNGNPEFKKIDYEKLNPKIIIDCADILPDNIKHYSIGGKYE